MSIRATQWAWGFSMPPMQKLVLLALADYADDSGLCWPSTQMISDKSGLSKRVVQYAMTAFREIGILAGGGKRGATSEMRLMLEVSEVSPEQISRLEEVSFHRKRSAPRDKRCAPESASCAPEKKEDVHQSTKRSAPRDKRCAPALAYIDNHQEPPIEPSVPPIAPQALPRVRVVTSDRDMRFHAKGRHEEVRIPDFIPMEAWNGFLEMRKRKGVKETAHAIRLLIGKLQGFFAKGHDIAAVLDESTMRNWTGVFEPKGRSQSSQSFQKPQSALAQQAERLRAQAAGGW